MSRPKTILVLLSMILISTTASAQTVERDPNTGDYVVRYRFEGEARELRVVARDRIEPRIRLSAIEPVSAGYRYTYVFVNNAGGRAIVGRGYSMVDLDCAPDVQPTGSTGQPAGWRMYTGTAPSGLKVCMFRGRPFLEPGDSATGFTVVSASLPRLGTADVYGKGEIPTVDDEALPDTVSAILDDLSTRGLTTSAVVPGRSAEATRDAKSSIEGLAQDLATLCGDSGLILDHGICRSLSAKLEAASASLRRGNTTSAQNQVQAVLAELSAQRNKAVPEEAYLLLNILADRALAQLRA